MFALCFVWFSIWPCGGDFQKYVSTCKLLLKNFKCIDFSQRNLQSFSHEQIVWCEPANCCFFVAYNIVFFFFYFFPFFLLNTCKWGRGARIVFLAQLLLYIYVYWNKCLSCFATMPCGRYLGLAACGIKDFFFFSKLQVLHFFSVFSRSQEECVLKPSKISNRETYCMENKVISIVLWRWGQLRVLKVNF